MELLNSWRENYAYTLGVQAYIYGFPWIYLPTLRWQWVTQPRYPANSPYAAVNYFWHARHLTDASYRDGGSPNNDTLYSTAWVDVTKEPVILTVPDMGDRYYTFEIGGMDSDNFAYIGKRTTGSKAGSYAIVGPDWKGKLPADVKALDPSRTPWVLILGRTLVNGPSDVTTVNKLQDEYRLTPLSLWRTSTAVPESRDVWAPFDPKSDLLAAWKTMNRAMTENPPKLQDSLLIQQFATIGVGPGQDVARMDEETKRGLTRAAVDGQKLLKDAVVSGDLGSQVNGWNFPPRDMGRAGVKGNFLLRGSVQCLGGIISNDTEEAVYLNTTRDGSGHPLNGTKDYVLHFEPSELPKVHAFWSMTMYGMDFNLVDNPINRYSIGDRTQGVKRDPNGGLTIYIRSRSPGQEKESNWLPSPPERAFTLILRTYMPSQEIIDGTWRPPTVTEVH
jgi:hypothetical protein